MSKPLQVRLTTADRKALASLVRGGSNRVRVSKRAPSLLLADVEGPKPRTQGESVAALGTSVTTVSATGRRYAQQGLAAALGEKPRPGREPKLTGEVEAQLVVLACSDPPAGQARWTVRLRAGELVRWEHGESIAPTAVGNALKKMKGNPGASKPGASLKQGHGWSPKWKTCWRRLRASTTRNLRWSAWTRSPRSSVMS